jgi:hypothetical protein
LRWTLTPSVTVDLPTLVIADIYTHSIGVTRTISCGAPYGAVDKGDVVPDLVVGDCVLELRVLVGHDGGGLADLHRCGGVEKKIGVPASGGVFDKLSPLRALYRLDPDAIVAAVGDDGVVSNGKAGLQCHKEDD